MPRKVVKRTQSTIPRQVVKRTQSRMPSVTNTTNALIVVGLIILVAYLFLKVRKIEGYQGEVWEIKWNEGCMIPEEKTFRRNLQGLLEKDFGTIANIAVRRNIV